MSCDQGIDLALVDRRDFLRQCELVIGGLPRVAIKGKPQLDGDRVALRLKCVATAEVQERRQAQAQGQAARPRQGHAQARQERSRWTSRSTGAAAASSPTATASRCRSSRKDKRGNGWRSAKTVRLG